MTSIGDPDGTASAGDAPKRGTLGEVARLFFKLGQIAFGDYGWLTEAQQRFSKRLALFSCESDPILNRAFIGMAAAAWNCLFRCAVDL